MATVFNERVQQRQAEVGFVIAPCEILLNFVGNTYKEMCETFLVGLGILASRKQKLQCCKDLFLVIITNNVVVIRPRLC